MTDNMIKSIVESTCPHCKKDIFIESVINPSVIGNVFNREQLEEAKKDLRLRIEALSVEEIKKQQVLAWINNPETVFSPAEVSGIIDSLLKPEE